MPMPMQPGKPKIQPAEMENGAEMEEGVPGTTLNIASYPELQAAEEGQKVMIQGTVQSNDGETVTIGHDSVKLQTNMADKALNRLTGKKLAPMPQGEDTGEEGY